jgi:hypothetical protein
MCQLDLTTQKTQRENSFGAVSADHLSLSITIYLSYLRADLAAPERLGKIKTLIPEAANALKKCIFVGTFADNGLPSSLLNQINSHSSALKHNIILKLHNIYS